MFVIEGGTKVDLKVNNLRKSYGATPVLTGVSFAVAHGEAVALIGSNGSGKSTLLKALPGLRPADSGQIEVLGCNLRHCKGRELRTLRSKIGFVFQRHNLVPRLSVLTNVLHGLQGQSATPRYWFQSFAPQLSRKRALECLELVGLAHLASRRADRLSGGQSQRVAIARALMQSPQIILADEPVASLDPVAGTEVMQLLFSLAKQRSITLLFTSHHLEHAIEYSDRIIGLKNGRIDLATLSNDISLDTLRSFYDQPHASEQRGVARAI